MNLLIVLLASLMSFSSFAECDQDVDAFDTKKVVKTEVEETKSFIINASAPSGEEAFEKATKIVLEEEPEFRLGKYINRRPGDKGYRYFNCSVVKLKDSVGVQDKSYHEFWLQKVCKIEYYADREYSTVMKEKCAKTKACYTAQPSKHIKDYLDTYCASNSPWTDGSISRPEINDGKRSMIKEVDSTSPVKPTKSSTAQKQ